MQLIDENNGDQQLTQQNACNVDPVTRENFRLDSSQVQFPSTHNAFQVLENEYDEIATELCKLKSHSLAPMPKKQQQQRHGRRSFGDIHDAKVGSLQELKEF